MAFVFDGVQMHANISHNQIYFRHNLLQLTLLISLFFFVSFENALLNVFTCSDNDKKSFIFIFSIKLCNFFFFFAVDVQSCKMMSTAWNGTRAYIKSIFSSFVWNQNKKLNSAVVNYLFSFHFRLMFLSF